MWCFRFPLQSAAELQVNWFQVNSALKLHRDVVWKLFSFYIRYRWRIWYKWVCWCLCFGQGGGSCTTILAEKGQGGGTKRVCFRRLCWRGGGFSCNFFVSVWKDGGGYVIGDPQQRRGCWSPLWEHTVCCCRQMMGRLHTAFRVRWSNFQWAADVGELAGGPVVAHNNNQGFPFSCADNNRRWALLHLQACQFFKKNSGGLCSRVLCSQAFVFLLFALKN